MRTKKQFKIKFYMFADGFRMIHNVNDFAIVFATSKTEAAKKLRERCRVEDYNPPIILNIKEV